MLAQGGNIVPIPGTKRVKYLEDNMGAPDVDLTAEDLQEIDGACAANRVSGERYTADMMKTVHG